MVCKVHRILQSLLGIQVFVCRVATLCHSAGTVHREWIAAFMEITVEAVFEDQGNAVEPIAVQPPYSQLASRYTDGI